MQYLWIYQTTPRHDATSVNSSCLRICIEFPQLLELAQKLYVLEDSGFTNQPTSIDCIR